VALLRDARPCAGHRRFRRVAADDVREDAMKRCMQCAVLGLLALSCATQTRAQDAVADFFKGKQVSIVIGSSAGGGYDTYARLLRRPLRKDIPGKPGIVPRNMPGAPTNTRAAHGANVAATDGPA